MTLKSTPNSLMSNGGTFGPERLSRVSKALQVAALAAATLPGLRTFAQTGNGPERDQTSALTAADMSRRIATARVERVNSIKEVFAPGAWSQEKNLWVRGNLLGENGKPLASDEKLQDLAAWLAQRPNRNWTVYVTAKVNDEQYTDKNGTRHPTGISAVKFCVGEGVTDTVGFTALNDPRTGQANGGFLVISFDASNDARGESNREITYFASDVYDSRGIGESSGAKERYFSAAKSAWQQGRDVTGMVKAFITAIDNDLDSAIAREQNDAKVKAENLKQVIVGAKSSLESLSVALARFHTTYPGRDGDLSKPDMAKLQALLIAAEAAADSKNLSEASAKAKGLQNEVNVLLQALSEYPNGSKRIETITKNLEQLGNHPYAASAKKESEAAQVALDKAKADWNRANSSYPRSIENAEQAVSQAQTVMGRAKAGAAAKSVLTFGALGAGVLGLGGVLGFLNLRSRQRNAEAKKQIERWSRALNEKSEGLADLERQARQALGNPFKSNIFEGETKERSHSVGTGLSRLIIMMGVAHEQLGKAKSALGRGSLFSTKQPDSALSILTKPLQFDPNSGVKEAVTGESSEGPRLLGALTDYDPFSIASLDALMKTFDEIGAGTQNALQSIKNGQENAGRDLNKYQEDIQNLALSGAGLKSKGETDGLLRCLAIETDFIPSAEQQISTARQMIKNDPLGGMALFASGQHRRRVLQKILEEVSAGREVIDQTIAPAISELQRSDIKTGWIQQKLKAISEKTDQLVSQLSDTHQPAAYELTVLSELDQLAKDTTRAVELNLERLGDASAAIQNASVNVNKVRANIASELQIDAATVLAEKDFDPAESIDAAQKSLLASAGMISEGNLVRANAALRDVYEHTAKANEIVNATAKGFAAHETTLAELQKVALKHAQAREAHLTIVTKIVDTFDEAVLKLSEGDISHPRADGNIGNNIQEFDETMTEVSGLFGITQKEFNSGKILGATATLDAAKQGLDFAEYSLKEITERNALLNERIAKNAERFKLLETQAADLARRATDREITSATIHIFEQAAASHEQALLAQSASKVNPFAVGELLAKTAAGFTDAERAIAKDHANHTEAVRSIADAAEKIRTFGDLLDHAAQDTITDSSQIQDARFRMAQIVTQLNKLKQNIRNDHYDWLTIDREADALAADAFRLAGIVKKEMAAGEHAVGAISSAAEAIRKAKNYDLDDVQSGNSHKLWGRLSYSERSRVSGASKSSNVGEGSLRQAREALNAGRYEQAQQSAKQASQEAARSMTVYAAAVIEILDAIAREHARAAARREAEERAARQARQRSSSSYSSGGGFGSSSGSGFGGGGSGMSFGGGFSGGGSGMSSGGKF